MSIRKLALGAISAAVVAIAPMTARADVVQLGFILDRSGSINFSSPNNWNTIVSGLSSAINTLIPITGTTQYEISVVSFSTAATIDVNSYLITDAASRTAVANLISGIGFTGGSTCYSCAFTSMQTALTDAFGTNGGGFAPTSTSVAATYVNFATDGEPNVNTSTTLSTRQSLINAGVDNISIEGIGTGVDQAYLTGSICYPGPCDTTSPYSFPTNGFYIGVGDAAEYVAAIGNKIRVVTGQIPEPGTIALVGLALVGAGMARRRMPA